MDNAQLKITELIKNKKVYHEYTIEDKYDAGMALEGWEVKAIRKHRINLQDSHIVVQPRMFLIGTHHTTTRNGNLCLTNSHKKTAINATRN